MTTCWGRVAVWHCTVRWRSKHSTSFLRRLTVERGFGQGQQVAPGETNPFLIQGMDVEVPWFRGWISMETMDGFIMMVQPPFLSPQCDGGVSFFPLQRRWRMCPLSWDVILQLWLLVLHFQTIFMPVARIMEQAIPIHLGDEGVKACRWVACATRWRCSLAHLPRQGCQVHPWKASWMTELDLPRSNNDNIYIYIEIICIYIFIVQGCKIASFSFHWYAVICIYIYVHVCNVYWYMSIYVPIYICNASYHYILIFVSQLHGGNVGSTA